MNPLNRHIVYFALVVFCAALIEPAVAQPQRRFVSGQGSDSNPCSLTAPCRSFQPAIDAVAAGGEVVVLDSAGYGAFAINKSITITAPEGVYAGITVFSGDGINIFMGPDDVAVLRGLTINGLGGERGIYFRGGAALFLENGVIDGFSDAGLRVQSGGQFFLSDTVVTQNVFGIIFIGTSGTAFGTLNRVHMEENSFGFDASNGTRVTIRDSVAIDNGYGIFVASAPTSSAEVNIESTLISGNSNTGVYSGGSTATGRVSNSTITNNGTGVRTVNSGNLLTRGNNTLEGNTTNGVFTGVISAQ